jgi:type IV pilus assembly protein PilE
MHSISRKSESGFGLIELMIAVAVIGILASIAWPAYQEHVRQSRRADAKSQLMQMVQCMERFNTSNSTYIGGPARCPVPPSQFYALNYGAVTRNAFAITAAPQGSQSTDSCGQLGINQAGEKTHQGGSSAKCW